MKRVTGTHVYQLPKCGRAVALDLHGDRDLRRPLRAEEELVLQRGRDHEADFVGALGWDEPAYPPRDFEAGARATRALLEAGVDGVLQGVLVGADHRLGIADLLRREAGASDLGDWHYVVGDVKSSARMRGDQILQVVFYSELLAALQGRMPDYGYLVMKDGREERFPIAAFRPALRDVLERIDGLRADPSAARPFLGRSCDHCRWSDVCLPELRGRGDLSLVHGMTEGLRTMLEAAGVATADALAELDVPRVARRTRIEPALLRRLVRAAQARCAGRPLPERTGRGRDEGPVAFVHLLTDAFEERALFVGVALPDAQGAFVACPPSAGTEWAAFVELIAKIPPRHRLVHYGRALPEWFERHAHGRPEAPWLEDRFVDLQKRLRGCASWVGPVFGLADHVRQALDRDPHRAGRAEAAALWAREDDVGRLTAKGTADLEDLRDLFGFWHATRAHAAEEAST